MTEPIHTPKPWTAHVYDDGSCDVRSINTDGEINVIADNVETVEDANLIAAAPDLLEDVECMVEALYAEHAKGVTFGLRISVTAASMKRNIALARKGSK